MSKQTELVDMLMANYSIFSVDELGDYATAQELLTRVYMFYPEIPHASDCPKVKDTKAECDCGIDKPYNGPCYT